MGFFFLITETHAIVFYMLLKFDSLFQIRGSIPILWEQIVDLSYKPRLRIIDHEETV